MREREKKATYNLFRMLGILEGSAKRHGVSQISTQTSLKLTRILLRVTNIYSLVARCGPCVSVEWKTNIYERYPCMFSLSPEYHCQRNHAKALPQPMAI